MLMSERYRRVVKKVNIIPKYLGERTSKEIIFKIWRKSVKNVTVNVYNIQQFYLICWEDQSSKLLRVIINSSKLNVGLHHFYKLKLLKGYIVLNEPSTNVQYFRDQDRCLSLNPKFWFFYNGYSNAYTSLENSSVKIFNEMMIV